MLTFEERKRYFLEEIKAAYFTKRRSKSDWLIQKDAYTPTWQIKANNNYGKPLANELLVKENPKIIMGIFVMIASIVAFISSYNETNIFFKACFIAFFCYAVKLLLDSKKKPAKIRLSAKGIHYYEWPAYIPWVNVVATCIQSNENDESPTEKLLIFYCFPDSASLEQRDVLLADLETDTIEISHYIEDLKMKAGFPTHPADY